MASEREIDAETDEECFECGGEGVVARCIDDGGCQYPEYGCKWCLYPCPICGVSQITQRTPVNDSRAVLAEALDEAEAALEAAEAVRKEEGR